MYIGSMRLYTFREVADGHFGESLIDVKADYKEKKFIINILDSVSEKQLKKFSEKRIYKHCRIFIFKQIPLKEVCKECK